MIGAAQLIELSDVQLREEEAQARHYRDLIANGSGQTSRAQHEQMANWRAHILACHVEQRRRANVPAPSPVIRLGPADRAE